MGISLSHLIIFLIIIIAIFGARRLPLLGQNLGKMMKNFRDGLDGVQEASFKKLDDDTPQQSPGGEQSTKKSKTDQDGQEKESS